MEEQVRGPERNARILLGALSLVGLFVMAMALSPFASGAREIGRSVSR